MKKNGPDAFTIVAEGGYPMVKLRVKYVAMEKKPNNKVEMRFHGRKSAGIKINNTIPT
ncbi:MAG: hypothetical protein PF503_15480 [Desulfobacula sp.]|nr:hypothetical protein [Desulfobacula sp.]